MVLVWCVWRGVGVYQLHGQISCYWYLAAASSARVSCSRVVPCLLHNIPTIAKRHFAPHPGLFDLRSLNSMATKGRLYKTIEIRRYQRYV